MFHEKTSLIGKVLVLAGIVGYFAIGHDVVSDTYPNDVAVYRAGIKVAFEGQSPYNTPLIQLKVAEVLPPKKAEDVALNCGFFLPPQAIAMGFPVGLKSKGDREDRKGEGFGIGWFILMLPFALSCGALAWVFGRSPRREDLGWVVIVLAVLLNPITQATLIVGQTSVFFVGCLAFSLYCFEHGNSRMGCFIWALTFIKPHLAIPFFVLAWILGGWKRAAGIAFVVALLNLIGGYIVRGSIGGSIDLFREYVDYVGSAHKMVRFNLVEENPQILSWNRLLYTLGGPAINLKVWTILTGFALWGALVFGRLRLGAPGRDPLSRQRLDSAYLLAVTAVGALFFTQAMGYELVLLAMLAPLLLQHFDNHRRRDGYVLIGILLYLMIPINVTGQIADRLKLGEESFSRMLLLSHKCFGMAALALYLLVRGPMAKPEPAPMPPPAPAELPG